MPQSEDSTPETNVQPPEDTHSETTGQAEDDQPSEDAHSETTGQAEDAQPSEDAHSESDEQTADPYAPTPPQIDWAQVANEIGLGKKQAKSDSDDSSTASELSESSDMYEPEQPMKTYLPLINHNDVLEHQHGLSIKGTFGSEIGAPQNYARATKALGHTPEAEHLQRVRLCQQSLFFMSNLYTDAAKKENLDAEESIALGLKAITCSKGAEEDQVIIDRAEAKAKVSAWKP